jgi:hypothetical protein
MPRSKIHAKTPNLNIFAANFGAPQGASLMSRIFVDFLGERDKIVI